jgi:hypothetical protein
MPEAVWVNDSGTLASLRGGRVPCVEVRVPCVEVRVPCVEVRVPCVEVRVPLGPGREMVGVIAAGI